MMEYWSEEEEEEEEEELLELMMGQLWLLEMNKYWS